MASWSMKLAVEIRLSTFNCAVREKSEMPENLGGLFLFEKAGNIQQS